MNHPSGSGPKKKRLERVGKSLARRILGILATTHRRKWQGIGKRESINKAIIIRQHNQFGDVLCTTPLFRALKTNFNLKELAVVVSPQNIDAVRGSRYVDKIINYDKLSFYRKPSLFVKFLRDLRNGYDLLLVPSNVSISLTNDILAFASKARTKIGPRSLEDKPNETMSVYDIAVELQWNGKIAHQARRNMEIAAALGINISEQGEEMEFEVASSDLSEASRFAGMSKESGPLRIAIHAGAGKIANRWNVWNFAKLSELLHDELDAELFFTEGTFDHEPIEHLINLVKVPFVRVRNRAIPFVAGILKRMNLVITNDTGIMHLAAAVGTPTLSLFGPTDPLQWGPAGKSHRFILGRNGDVNSIKAESVYRVVRKMIRAS